MTDAFPWGDILANTLMYSAADHKGELSPPLAILMEGNGWKKRSKGDDDKKDFIRRRSEKQNNKK